MKNNLLFSIFALTLILTTSCKDKLNLVSGAKEAAVVVGILDKSETTHYIKITRSFIGDGATSALDIAKISDSSYFENIEVKVTEILPGGATGRVFNLYDTIIGTKNVNGVFYAPDQKVYIFHTPENNPLRADATYRLNASVDDGRMVITGETKLVDGITAGSWTSPNIPFKLTSNSNVLGEYSNQVINYTSVGNSYLLNCKVRFDYLEYTNNFADSVEKSVVFDLGEYDVTPSGNSNQTFVLSGTTFYNTLKTQIPVSNTVNKRVMKGFDMIATGGSRELANYISVNKPSVTLAQNKPTFTNLKVTEGFSVIGIFASRFTLSKYRFAVGTTSFTQALDKKSRRELSIGPLTYELGFCSNHSIDNSETYSCPN